MMKRNKKELWRIIVGILSILYIIFIWLKKDIANIYATMPQEQIVPLVTTTILVTLVKVVVLTGIILLVKWVFYKIKK